MNALALDVLQPDPQIQERQQPRHLKRHSFTPENARDAALKGWQARKLRAKEQKALAKVGATMPTQCVTLQRVMDSLLRRIETEKRVERLTKLVAAHGRLFKSWQVLAGVPNPGSRRAKSRGPVAGAAVEPMQESAVEPLPEEPKSGADCPK